MLLKFLQLNIYRGKWLSEIISFIKKNKFDIIHLQEVCGGLISYNNADDFQELQQHSGYQGELLRSWTLVGDEASYFGNATFFNPSFHVTKKDVFRLSPSRDVVLSETDHYPLSNEPRTAYILALEKDGQTITTVNTHLERGNDSYDDENKLRQGAKLASYLQTLPEPYIISGDFNVTPDSQVVKNVSVFGRNLVVENNIKNTLNPRKHAGKHLFPPGLAVDYIFPSPKVQVKKFSVLSDLDLSDHLGLSMEFEI